MEKFQRDKREKRRIRRYLLRIIEESAQLRAEIERWNQERTDERPIDVGGDLCTEMLARRVLACVDANQPIPEELRDRFLKQLEDNARR
jgi:hypothetical protein